MLFHWCERNGLGPLGVTGLSMGGHVSINCHECHICHIMTMIEEKYFSMLPGKTGKELLAKEDDLTHEIIFD